jgi:hypothetical protein
MAMNEDVVRVASIRQVDETKREITLEVEDDPSGQFLMTVVGEQMPNGRWRQVQAS